MDAEIIPHVVFEKVMKKTEIMNSKEFNFRSKEKVAKTYIVTKN